MSKKGKPKKITTKAETTCPHCKGTGVEPNPLPDFPNQKKDYDQTQHYCLACAKPLCHQRDPETSKKAAVDVVKSGLRDTMHHWILNILETATSENLTAKEMAARHAEITGQHWSMSYHAIARRLNELIKSGEIVVACVRKSTVGNNGKDVQAYRIKQ